MSKHGQHELLLGHILRRGCIHQCAEQRVHGFDYLIAIEKQMQTVEPASW